MTVKDPTFFINRVFRPIERDGGKVTKIVMSPHDYADLVRTGRDVLDPCTDADLVRTGFAGSLFATDLHVDKVLQSDHFKLTVEKDGQTKDYQWCYIGNHSFNGPFCTRPDCIVEYVHET